VMWTAERDTNETTSTTTPSTFEDPDGSEERYHDLAAAVMPDEAAQAQEQRCGEEDVRGCDEEPHPPEPVSQQIPVRMLGHESKRDENSSACEGEGRRIVTCLARRRAHAVRVRRDRFGGLSHIRTRMETPSDGGADRRTLDR
jgi:hypothetical protein